MRIPEEWKQGMSHLLTVFCRFLYILGIQSMRVMKRLRRRCARFFKPFWNLCKLVYGKTIGRRLVKITASLRAFYQSMVSDHTRLKQIMEEGREKGGKERVKSVGKGVFAHKRLILTVLNVAAPIAAVLVLASTVKYWTNMDYGLLLSFDGQEIAAIQDEKVFERATEMVNQRMVYDTATTTDVKLSPTFQLAITDKARYAAPSTLCDKIIQRSDSIIEEGSGLYVDGNLVGAVKSSADMTYILQNLLNTARGSDLDADVSFVENVETINGLFPTASIVSAKTMDERLNHSVVDETTYTVEAGDTATAIAEKYDLSLDELNQMNESGIGDSLQVGAKVKVQSTGNLLKVKVVKRESYESILNFKTVTVKDDSQFTDYTKVTTEGKQGLQDCVDEVTYVDGVEVSRTAVSRKTVTAPVDKEIITGTKKRPAEGYATGQMIWPVPSIHNITSYFEYRWGTMHWGLDISGGNSYGKTIVAADGGTVSYARYSDVGYGNHLEIDHGNGLVTLYAHTSKILVKSGQKVAKGQPIALVGNSGDSTGAHCHFEVIQGGTKVDPLKYVSN